MSLQRVVRKKIGELLVDAEVITELQLKEALNTQKQKGGILGEILVDMGVAKEEDIASCLAIQYGIPSLNVQNYEFNDDLLTEFAKEMKSSSGFIPLDKMGKVLTVAVTNPLAEEELESLEKKSGGVVKYFLCTSSDFKAAMKQIDQKNEND